MKRISAYRLGVNSMVILLLSLILRCADAEKSESYLDLRQQLVENDRNQRFDADLTLNEKEEELNELMIKLQKDMLRSYNAQSFFPPAEPFYQSKAHIEKTTLFKLFQKMPKGGIQHLHSTAAIDFAWLINRASKESDCYIYWGQTNEKYIKGQIHFYKAENVPEGFQPAATLLKDQRIRRELNDMLTVREEVELDSTNIWIGFEEIFNRVNGFFYYKPMYQDFLQSAIDTLRADQIQHVEFRNIFYGGLYDLDHDLKSGYYNADTTMALLQELVNENKKEHPDFSLKVIYTYLRFLPEELVLSELISAFRFRKQYPDLIKGFDLVANEDQGHTTLFFLENWEKMDSLSKVYGVDMPLYLHDGESDWASVQNLYDAYLLESKRIGHGFNLMHFPALIEKIKTADICIEVSPLSNQILGYIGDLRLHPANYMLKNGVQCSINSDDPGIFGYNGLSYDYWSIFLAWELDLKAIKKLALNSLTYSALSEEEKAQSIKLWEQRWAAFVTTGIQLLKEEQEGA